MKMKRMMMALAVLMIMILPCSALALNRGAAGTQDAGSYYSGTRSQAMDYSFGFGYESYLKGQNTWKVYTAPSMDAFRAANGKASVHMEDDIYSAGWSGAWLLIRYPKVTGGFRVGWVPKSEIGTRKIERTRDLDFAYWTVTLNRSCSLTDDPLYESDVLATASAGETLTYLAYYQYNGGREYAYVQGDLDGQPVCGFIPFDAIAW